MKKLAENVSVAFFDDQRVKEPGFYTLKGDTTEDENGVTHETNMEPDTRVYPHPDGEGWTETETVLYDGEVMTIEDAQKAAAEADGGEN